MKLLPQVLLFVLTAAGVAAAIDRAPLHLPSGQAQLFADDFLIESQQGLKRTLHQPKKDHGGIAKLSQGKPVRLQFTIENGSLYSFTVGRKEPK